MVPRPNLKVSDRTGLKSPPQDRTLRFRKDGTFHIAVFEDLHFAEHNDKDAKSKKVMSYILAEEDIDFVVLNGDLVSGERTLKSNSSEYVLSVISPLVNEGYLWASTYGNHDSEINLDPEEDVFKTETRFRSSLTQSRVSGPRAGITNYYLPVFSHSASKTNKPALLLWFFDSKGGHYHQKNGEGGLSAKRPNWIDGSVVDWFTSTNSKLKAEFGVIPSLAFYHIPTHAMLHYQQEGSVHPQLNPGHNCERVKAQGTIDWSYGSQDVKFMKALLETEGLVAGFSAHDHQNDWCFKWDESLTEHGLTGNGINLCFGRHTGYGGYGNLTRGSRQILLHESNLRDNIETWVRLENGAVSGNVTLNSTYGQDLYQTVTNGVGKPSVHVQGHLLSVFSLWACFLALWR
ncbi:hypothetical protein N7499_004327 [Penicillium canescens]|uniref:Calcineurin-like phosphoesterase domain-containing protein n=1 Tax=Penicillium canescens TaxID=5083 RepID=A0AAD6IAG2_PENCN|nr:uncharacterized protein N7446_005381 [Penicillium canescens]KAJ6010270.1 hypothetical protein N7522_005286 [Penicillium canescens]KAJ6038578.1 hypothetical protein N7460_008349 [Penicillium canescens]KAJ6039363.1 hypothetical protein N7444_008268 [Penicillium canescens]KAJ6068344.1 hypothetical protein N7446_005381 [Penicillium canescens]KAJ6084698.1 hypothetical protein N7499_004327 [Penicillium canescens]